MIDASEAPLPGKRGHDPESGATGRTVRCQRRSRTGYVAKVGQSHRKNGFTQPKRPVVLWKRPGSTPWPLPLAPPTGFMSNCPELQLDLLQEIHEATDVTLVLHGSSGIPHADLQKALKEESVKSTWLPKSNIYLCILCSRPWPITKTSICARYPRSHPGSD